MILEIEGDRATGGGGDRKKKRDVDEVTESQTTSMRTGSGGVVGFQRGRGEWERGTNLKKRMWTGCPQTRRTKAKEMQTQKRLEIIIRLQARGKQRPKEKGGGMNNHDRSGVIKGGERSHSLDGSGGGKTG